MIAYVRHKDILGELYIPSKENNNNIGLVWLPGLPNKPIADDMGKPLSDLGFTVLQARYPGSWQSYGDFGPSSSVEGALLGAELLSSGRTINLDNQKEIVWDIKNLVLVGSSYGGGIAISALGSTNLADAAIAFCPLIEPELQNADESLSEDDLSTLYPYLKRCHENVFRNLKDEEWNDYINGTHHTVPSKYLSNIKEKALFLVHGSEDKSIRKYHTENFYYSLKRIGSEKVRLHIEDGVGHGTGLRLSTKDIWTEWLIDLFN
ncbi:alpha/beta hydrolase family protein [Viridibacillus arvi]|uniref:alpha/beta hydrolase family protein n=1 Tax=Viridibacillus arvi TaxID=263475 RepID=UPI0036C649EB